jgi:hypothetical protein
MQLYEILCVLETNSVATLLYMASACTRDRYHCAVSSALYGLVRRPSGVETLEMLEVLS